MDFWRIMDAQPACEASRERNGEGARETKMLLLNQLSGSDAFGAVAAYVELTLI
jgi:hypothetical protein